jgi:hypothetical protein
MADKKDIDYMQYWKNEENCFAVTPHPNDP